jgi:NitT/TauT family transport system ATP-binding protein
MQRRIALARAFAIQPQILLLDEPFVSLDAPTATQLRHWLLALCEQQDPTVLVVTHDCREALALANRILFLSGSPGCIVLDYRVPLPRPREIDDRRLLAVYDDLLAAYPQLLSGLTSDSNGEGAAAGSAEEGR